MAGIDRLQQYLDEHEVAYEIARHPIRYTMQEVAAEVHLPGRKVAKVVMAFAGERMIMLVVPAFSRLTLNRVRELLAGEEVRLAHEGEFAPLFPD
jgi:Ala-tRNA(Pro) deacylase